MQLREEMIDMDLMATLIFSVISIGLGIGTIAIIVLLIEFFK